MLAEARTSARTAARESKEVAIPGAVSRLSPAVVGALARIEVWKLLTSPAFFAGFGLVSAFVFLATGGLFMASDDGSNGKRAVVLVIGAGIGLIAATLLGSNACALRAHRDHLRELFGSIASPPEARTSAVLLAVLVGPAALAAAIAVIAYPVLRSDPNLRSSIDVALLGQYPLTVLTLGTFGIALARWVRHPIAAPVALVLLVMSPLQWAVPWISPSSSGIRIGWHYTYLIAAIVFWSSLAFAGDRRRVRALAVPAVALTIGIVAASFQIPPGGLI